MEEPPERELQALLVQLADINTLIDEYEGTRDQQFLARVTEQMRHLAPKMKQLTVGQEGRSPEYSALRNKLTTGMREAVNRLKSLTPPAVTNNNTTSGNGDTSETSGPQTSEERQVVSIPPAAIAPPPPPPTVGAVGSSLQHGTAPPIQLSGWLKKQGEKGPIKSWKKRYFRQNDSKLFYATNDTTLTTSGFIDLQQVTSILPGKGPTVFDLVTNKRTFHLKAFDATDRKRWIEGLTFWRNVYSTINQLNSAPSTTPPALGSTPNNRSSSVSLTRSSESLTSDDQGRGKLQRETSLTQVMSQEASNISGPQTTVTMTTTTTFISSTPPSSSSPSVSSSDPQQDITSHPPYNAQPLQPVASLSDSQSTGSEYRLERSHTVASGANVKDFPKKNSALSRELQRSQSSVNAKAQMLSALEENLSKKEGEIKRLNALVYQLRNQLKTTQEELESAKLAQAAAAPPPPAEQELMGKTKKHQKSVLLFQVFLLNETVFL